MYKSIILFSFLFTLFSFGCNKDEIIELKYELVYSGNYDESFNYGRRHNVDRTPGALRTDLKELGIIGDSFEKILTSIDLSEHDYVLTVNYAAKRMYYDPLFKDDLMYRPEKPLCMERVDSNNNNKFFIYILFAKKHTYRFVF